jgi:hypothetical protein
MWSMFMCEFPLYVYCKAYKDPYFYLGAFYYTFKLSPKLLVLK